MISMSKRKINSTYIDKLENPKIKIYLYMFDLTIFTQ